jgi:hypothetical protein
MANVSNTYMDPMGLQIISAELPSVYLVCCFVFCCGFANKWVMLNKYDVSAQASTP